jgi:hypothetical protein
VTITVKVENIRKNLIVKPSSLNKTRNFWDLLDHVLDYKNYSNIFIIFNTSTQIWVVYIENFSYEKLVSYKCYNLITADFLKEGNL